MNTELSESSARKVILLLCGFAAVHVFIFAAAFPFFNVVDEQAHIDLAVRYSRGDIPKTITPPCAEARPFFLIYGTPEYIWPPSSQPNGQYPPPPWKQSFTEAAPLIQARESAWKNSVNHEASQPPLYYVIAGAWWQLGKALKFDGGFLLYWLRFFNIPVVIALVWIGWFTARKVFPEDSFVQLTVPALIAFMPQMVFYSINNDVFSPLTFGIAFFLSLKLKEMKDVPLRLAAFTGLALAATFLTKISNLPLLVVSAIFIALKIHQAVAAGKLKTIVWPMAVLFFCAVLPMMAWMVWCKINFGDFTGSSSKLEMLGWTRKPFGEWWHHPIFTPAGFWTFLSGNLATLWQGEILWHGRPLTWPIFNFAYSAISIALLGIAFAHLFRKISAGKNSSSQSLWLAFGCLGVALAFYGWLSIIYDFHDCFYPSREHPYFTSGRLLLGALIPFTLLIAQGLALLLNRVSLRLKWFVLAGTIFSMLICEVVTDWPVFSNPYNWFHM